MSNSSSLVIDAAVEANKSRQKGMVLPFEPHSITFDDIIYSVDMPQVLNECLKLFIVLTSKLNILFCMLISEHKLYSKHIRPSLMY